MRARAFSNACIFLFPNCFRFKIKCWSPFRSYNRISEPVRISAINPSPGILNSAENSSMYMITVLVDGCGAVQVDLVCNISAA